MLNATASSIFIMVHLPASTFASQRQKTVLKQTAVSSYLLRQAQNGVTLFVEDPGYEFAKHAMPGSITKIGV